MRQAGRYLPEYLELRQRYPNFWQRCKNPSLAAEITLQPLKRFNLDAAIVFSDILTIPDACGHPVEFVTGRGPIISNPIRQMADVEQLPAVEKIDQIDYIYEALQLTRQQLGKDKTMVGFAGSPWTVATYMLEGEKSKNHHHSLNMVYQHPEVVGALVERLTQYTIRYLLNQIKAGAEMVQIFDTWGHVLPAQWYDELSLKPLKTMIEQIRHAAPNTPIIFFGKGINHRLTDIAACQPDGMSLDWTISLTQARQLIPPPMCLQGNLDPRLLHARPEAITRAVQSL